APGSGEMCLVEPVTGRRTAAKTSRRPPATSSGEIEIMSKTRLALAALAASAIVGSTPTVASDNDSDAMAKHQCAPMAHHTEVLNPGVQAPAASAAAGQQTNKQPPLWDNLGTLTWKVTTRSDLAQRYFDQGLRLAYAFNHVEAGRSFRAAEAADPGCAMCY